MSQSIDEMVKILKENENRKIIALEKAQQDKNLQKAFEKSKIFIVHGHNELMKLAVENTLLRLNLNPIILDEKVNQGNTIIEKFEKQSTDVRFAVVLLSPDDELILNGENIFRARQNVIFELGHFVSKLGRQNVVVLYVNNKKIELPSDIDGIVYIPYEGTKGNWRLELVSELRTAGYNVNADMLL